MYFSHYAISDVGQVRTGYQDHLYRNGLYRRDAKEDGVFLRSGTFRDGAILLLATAWAVSTTALLVQMHQQRPVE